MTNKNYSKDAELLDIEEFDYDTIDINETEINDGRMRLPTRYDISKYYQRNVRNRGKHRAGEYGRWKKKSEEELLDFSNDFDWQITYSFPSTLRNNRQTPTGKEYGGKNVTFRRLYLILCETFNGGQYFIDEYFESVYPYTIKPEIDEKLGVVKEELLEVAESMLYKANEQNIEEGLQEMKVTKSGKLNKSASRINKRANKALDEYTSFAKGWEQVEGFEIASRIREDIISSITTGILPCQLNGFLSENTIKKRISVGLSDEPLFSATEQLINSIQLFVDIGGNRKWQTQSGLLV